MKMKKITLFVLVTLSVFIIAGCGDNTTHFPTNDDATISTDRSKYEPENEPESNANADSASHPESELIPEISGGTPLAPESSDSTGNSAYRGTVIGLMFGTPPADNPDATPTLLVTLQHSEGEDYGQSTLMVTIDGSTIFYGITLSDVINGAYLEVAFDCDPAQGHVNATSVNKFPAE